MVIDHTSQSPKDNILCITYTNRAADELKKGVSSKQVYIGTIHSFLNGFIGIYFSHRQVIDLYFERYGDEIRKRIDDVEQKYSESNKKYLEKYDALTYEVVYQNLDSLYYNENRFNSLYYGGLSHDDLLSFAKLLFDRFPVIRKRLTQKYQLIFVDEYQDTSADVLRIFFDSVKGTMNKLFFLGDKMQQIFSGYDGSFESELSKLNKSIILETNHRSIPVIIDILNRIYNDESLKQIPSPKNCDIVPKHAPRVLICDDIQGKMAEERTNHPDALLLLLLNRERFDAINAGNLYRQVSRMDRYSYGKKYSPVDVLSDDTNENPDPLIRLLFLLQQISDFYNNMNMGGILQISRANAKIFSEEAFKVTKHEDKVRLNKLLKSTLGVYNDLCQPNSINDVLTSLKKSALVKPEYIESFIESGEYSDVISIGASEFRAIAEYLKNPHVSTQHGVKGESHDTVFFIAEDSTRTPVVHMYKFFSLLCNVDISLDSFESFYYDYSKWIRVTSEHLGFKPSKFNKGRHTEYQSYLEERIRELLAHFSGSDIFHHLCSQEYHNYLSKPNVTNAKKCFKESIAHGALSAYRLFYVGCSRARKNLTIFIDKSKISSFETELINKFKEIGFTIEFSKAIA
jgi:DNA helicase-2/ATP-dependent DNA helicase PcrA